MTTAELATLLEVTTTSIYYWKRRLRERDQDVHNAAAGPGTAKVGLVEVRVASSNPRSAPSPDPFELRLAGERTIMVPADFDPDALRALVGALEAC